MGCAHGQAIGDCVACDMVESHGMAPDDPAVKLVIGVLEERDAARADVVALAEALECVNRANAGAGVEVAPMDVLLGEIERLKADASRWMDVEDRVPLWRKLEEAARAKGRAQRKARRALSAIGELDARDAEIAKMADNDTAQPPAPASR